MFSNCMASRKIHKHSSPGARNLGEVVLVTIDISLLAVCNYVCPTTYLRAVGAVLRPRGCVFLGVVTRIFKRRQCDPWIGKSRQGRARGRKCTEAG